ncbi:MAG: ATP-binding protein [Bacteroidales bacterium]|nr:ATP-binding protein [Bacteroidales bacterium]
MEKRFGKNRLIKIAITGPESTGKSSLAEYLALHYNSVWVPEFAREYLNTINREYNYDDILIIAKKQIKKEESFANKANGILFCDTELLVTKIWCEYKYKQCHNWILDNILKHKYNLFLLCDIDLEWKADPLREHPNARKELLNLYIRELEFYNFPYYIVSGKGQDRFDNAINYINEYLKFY